MADEDVAGVRAAVMAQFEQAQADRAVVCDVTLMRAVGQQIGLRQIPPQQVWWWILAQDMIYRQNEVARAVRFAAENPLPARDAANDDGTPVWPDDATYAFAAAADLGVPRHNEAWVAEAYREIAAYAEKLADWYAEAVEAARKAIGPVISRQAGKAAAMDVARKAAALVREADLSALVDEEAAWWLRWRHVRGIAA